jgi:hypothetical protein
VRAVGAKPYLMMVWPRRGNGAGDVITSYAAAAATSDSTLIPAGAAWDAALRRMPTLSLYRWDGIHPNRLGTYLAALTVYAGLRGTAPIAPNALVVEQNPFWIPQATARALRDSVREAIAARYRSSACST